MDQHLPRAEARQLRDGSGWGFAVLFDAMVPNSLVSASIERLEKRIESEATDDDSVRRYHALFQERKDTPDQLFVLARSTTNAHAAGAALAIGILRCAQQNQPVDARVDSLFGAKTHVQAHWDLRSDWDGLTPTLAAFRALGPDRGAKILARLLATDFSFSFAWLFLHQFPQEAELQSQAFHRLLHWRSPSSEVAMGISLFQPGQLGWLSEALGGDASQCANLARLGIQAAMMRAALRRETWDIALDCHLDVHGVWTDSDFMFAQYAAPVLREAIAALPQERAATWFDQQSQTPLTPSFKRLILVVPRANSVLIGRLMELLSQNAKLVGKPAFDWLTDLTRELGQDAAVHLPALKGKKKLLAAFEAGLGDMPTVSVAPTPAKPKPTQTNPKKAAAIAKVEKLAAEARGTGPNTWLYALETLPRTDEGSVSRVGGPGFDLADQQPSLDGLPMSHVLTLDLRELPELQELWPEKRALAVYVSEPGGTAWDPDSAVVTLTDEDVARGEAAVDAVQLPLKGVRATRVEVPQPTFASPTLHPKLLRAILALPARVGGQPSWLQQDLGSEGFLMQFDARFVPINLGDGGLMYVFEHGAFSQSR